MGTKIEHAFDPLTATSTNSNSSFTLPYRVDDWNYLQARKLNKFHKTDNNFSDSMEKMLEKHNIESIKKTMQIQEEIFKHQVQELHRLYSVQKRLMGERKQESNQNTRIWSSSEINHSQFSNKGNISDATTTAQKNSGFILHFQNVIDDARERSGSCSGETIMKMARGGFDLERPATLEDNNMTTGVSTAIDEENAAGPSNKMSTDHHGSDDNEDGEVELTLSIGASSSNKKKKSKGYKLGCLDSPASFKSDRGEDSSCPNTPMSSSSATFDREKKMPHWLFGLSINRS